MALADIRIYRSWPVINGYVQVPHNKPSDKTRVTIDEALSLIPGSEAAQLSLGSGRATGSKHGQQEFLRLPPVAADSWYSTNPDGDAAQPQPAPLAVPILAEYGSGDNEIIVTFSRAVVSVESDPGGAWTWTNPAGNQRYPTGVYQTQPAPNQVKLTAAFGDLSTYPPSIVDYAAGDSLVDDLGRPVPPFTAFAIS